MLWGSRVSGFAQRRPRQALEPMACVERTPRSGLCEICGVASAAVDCGKYIRRTLLSVRSGSPLGSVDPACVLQLNVSEHLFMRRFPLHQMFHLGGGALIDMVGRSDLDQFHAQSKYLEWAPLVNAVRLKHGCCPIRSSPTLLVADSHRVGLSDRLEGARGLDSCDENRDSQCR